MQEIRIDTQAVEKENKEVAIIVQEAQQIVISNNEQYQGAASYLKKIKGKSSELDTLRKSLTAPLDLSKRKIMELFKFPIEMLQKAEHLIKAGMIEYTEKQERIRREQEEKLRKAAEAEETRKRKALEERARKAEEQGKLEKAEELREKAEEVKVEAPILADRVETPKGVSYREQWDFRIIDVNIIPREYLVPNETMLRKFAIATKGQVPVAGIEFYSEKVVSSRF